MQGRARTPAEVIADPILSKGQKLRVLESLEQDARQLSVASDEGMEGGERTNLRDVLLAKESLDLPPSGAPTPGSRDELEEELAKEKLDP
jgi:hypothetical protein